ncbi:MAG: hypothetical protein ACE5IC_04920 [Candidatus Brocadiales bacterium]
MKDYSKYYRPEELEPFYPNEFLRHILVILILIIGLLLGVMFLPESAQDALGIGEDAPEEKPLWYLLPIYELSRLVADKTAFFAILGCAAAALLSVPFWDRTKEKRLWRRPVFFPIVIVCLMIILTLGILGKIL